MFHHINNFILNTVFWLLFNVLVIANKKFEDQKKHGTKRNTEIPLASRLLIFFLANQQWFRVLLVYHIDLNSFVFKNNN